jgi:hypothetical protein
VYAHARGYDAFYYRTEDSVTGSESETNLHAAITQSGQITKDIHRLELERFTEVLDSFRSTMLRMYDELLTRVVDLEGRVDAIERRIHGDG